MAPRRQRVVVRTWQIKAIGNSKRSLAFGETITEAWWSRFNFAGSSARHHYFTSAARLWRI
jgi:hypothetical protein